MAVVENVISAPDYRRRGIGRALMEHARDLAQQKGCFKLTPQTGAGRTGDHLFYEACGFRGDKRGFQLRFEA